MSTLHVYALYNQYLGIYDLPFFAKEEEDSVHEAYRRSILSDPDKFYGAWCHEKTVCYLGEFDEQTGILTPIEKPKTLFALAKLFPPGYIAKKEALKDGNAGA